MDTPITRTRLQRRAAPFVLAIGAAFGLSAVPPYPPNQSALIVAGAWASAVVALTMLLPWDRLPSFTHPGPALAFLPPIALLNHAEAETISIYAPLAILPVVWIALFASRWALGLALALVVLMYALPVFALGSDVYTSSEWKLAVLWIVTAFVLGLAVEGLVRLIRSRAEEASGRVELLEERDRLSRRLLENARLLAGALDKGSARTCVCDAARSLADASWVGLFEPDGGQLALTASAGGTLERIAIPLDAERSETVQAYTSTRPVFLAGAGTRDGLSRRLGRRRAMASLHFEPILRGREPVGVIVVGWEEPVHDSEVRRDALGLIAAEAAMALERADLLARLELAARTDELTGLPNRRGWDDEIGRELARASRNGAPLCVAVLDLDSFKRLNDERGHQAGDRLLKEAAAAWRVAIRATDVLARYGGEEFTVALPACSLAGAERLVERLRAATPGGQTVSAGIAQWDGAESAESLFARADTALLESKAAGKDRVTLAVP
jgi:diguanylate cyclase (GGDEF)-like protein